jgi:hypothetical protein
VITQLGRWVRHEWDRALAIALVVAGLVVIYLGWRGVSGHVLPAEQIPYLASAAVLGLFFLGAAATLWLSAALRDEWRKLAAGAEELKVANARAATPPVDDTADVARTPRQRRSR